MVMVILVEVICVVWNIWFEVNMFFSKLIVFEIKLKDIMYKEILE